MTLVGMELNSTRARTVHGPAFGLPVALALEDSFPDLPLALSLEGRTPVAGRSGMAICRKLPHAACTDFLPHLGGERTWAHGRHRLDAEGALTLACETITPRVSKSLGIAVTLPAYFDDRQRALLSRVVAKARWRLLATVSAPVAAALAGSEYLSGEGLALIGDVDGHMFTWSVVRVSEQRAQVLETVSLAAANRSTWLRRLIDGVALHCIRKSRRDPRESAEAEQSLHDQLAEHLDGQAEASRIEMIIHTKSWFQNLMFDTDDLRRWCVPVANQAVAGMLNARELAIDHGAVTTVLLTAAAGRLPGLITQIEDQFHPPAVLRQSEAVSDFGDGLLIDDTGAPRVFVLEPASLARAAHAVASQAQRGDLPSGHCAEISLPSSGAAYDSGPARLYFRGSDHLIARKVFTLGRDPACDLVFESELYPSVSARHCEIVVDRQACLLRDRSRHGTLVNDAPVQQQTSLRPGDWIRLGPTGPVMRFLGQPGDPRTLVIA